MSFYSHVGGIPRIEVVELVTLEFFFIEEYLGCVVCIDYRLEPVCRDHHPRHAVEYRTGEHEAGSFPVEAPGHVQSILYRPFDSHVACLYVLVVDPPLLANPGDREAPYYYLAALSDKFVYRTIDHLLVIDLERNAAGPVLAKFRDLPEYQGVFTSGSDALVRMQPGALVIVVDTNRPDMVESPQLLESCNRVAVIDHHRRAASYIENAAFSFHEPYASSASELVTELLQYLAEPADLLREEAEALLAGIVLDTKHFTLRTGGRTFEAAAFLRRAGADTTDVQRLFQSDLSEMVSRYDIIRRAELYREDIAVAVIDRDGVDRVTAAQAADELLSLKGVHASFVVFPNGGDVQMSARSLGEVNVQVILEALGGGGNSTTAGGRVENTDVETVKTRLLEAIDAYFEK